MRLISMLLLLLFILSGCGKLSDNQQLTLATDAYDKSDYNQSVILLKRLLTQSPNNNNARILLASSYTQQGHFLNAYKEWDLTIGDFNSVDFSTALPLYFETLYILDNDLELIEFWEKHSEILPLENQSNYAYFVVLSLIKLNEVEKANTLIKNINELENSSVSNLYSELPRFLSSQSMYDKTQHLTNACFEDKKKWIICTLASDGLYKLKNYSDAINIQEEISKNRPFYYPAKIKLAQSYIHNKELSKATPLLKELLNIFPNQPLINQLNSIAAIQMKDFEKAKTYIDKSLAHGQKVPSSELLAALINFKLENYEQAFSHLNGLKELLKDNILFQKMYIATQLKLGNAHLAHKELDNINLTNDNAILFAETGLALLSKGDVNASSELLEKVTTENIKSNSLLGQVGIAKLAVGNMSGIKDIESLLNKALQEGENESITQTKYLLISSLLVSDLNEEALNQISKWIKEEPKNVENYLLQAKVYKKQFPLNEEKTDSSFTKVLQLQPSNSAANLYFAYAALKDEKYVEAIEFYQTVLNENNQNIMALKGLYYSYLKSQNKKKALYEIQKHLQNHKDNPQEALILAQLYLEFQSPNDAINTLDNLSFQDDAHQNVKYLILADSYLYKNNYNEAIKYYDKINLRKSVNMNVIQKQSYAYEAANRINDGLNMLEKVTTAYPENISILLLKTNFSSILNQKEKVLKVINTLTVQQKETPLASKIIGRTHYQQGNYTEAIQFLNIDYNASKSSKIAALIFDSYVKSNQTTKALAFLRNHLDSFPKDLPNRMIYVNELIKHDKNKAIIEYKHILKLDNNNVLSLNNLAWYLYEQGKLEEAYNYAKRAKELAPSNVNILDTYNKVKSALDAK